MSSSDSEDDCYGNAAQKLQQILLNKKKEHLITDTFNDSFDRYNLENPLSISGSHVTNTDRLIKDHDYVQVVKETVPKNNKRVTRSKGNVEAVIVDPVEPPSKRTRAKTKKNSEGTQQISRTPETGRGRSKRARNIRGRNTSRGRANRSRSTGRGRGNSHRETEDIPTFSIGNTDYYPDTSHSQTLFVTKPKDVVVLDTEDLDNEELSVKVYWKSSEIFKFQIRKYQKLKPIFDHFGNKENISNEKLYFTYNDVVIKIDDSPDSIGYNISRFIEGGIVNECVDTLTPKLDNDIVNGINVKFQCQNEKKPFQITISKDDTMSLAMLKCAEHFEKVLEKLLFYFDGDLISGKNTPKDLELEDGDCIDVKIVR
ncbi:DNA repair protein Rad60 [Bombyx mori]|uniref:Rad60/SUMO-like domain-containing protein n=1 Tax=Bombyx mori TaxID=7091 RepID=A0A8R2ASP2_BOMMO|nr:uncharacterized protein CG4449 [Bombyx mori]